MTKQRNNKIAYTTGTLGTPTRTRSYTYGNAYKDLLTSYNGQAITYDEMARPLSYKGNSLSWVLGNLYAYGSTTFEYLYDNTRFLKKAGSVTTYYYYNEGRLLGETRGNSTIRYLYDQSGIIGFAYNGVVYRYIKNLQGDIIAIYNSATKVAEYAYDAWGNCTITQDTNGIGTFNAIRYRGYYFDVETGLYYLLSRYYDPETGRFISPDDVSYLDPETINGLNLFAYCNNNPVMGTDPDGTIGFFTLLIGFLVGFVINAAISLVEEVAERGDINVGKIVFDGIMGGIGGMVAATGLGRIAMTGVGAVLGFVQGVGDSLIEGKSFTAPNTWYDIGKSTAITAISFFVGGEGATNIKELTKDLNKVGPQAIEAAVKMGVKTGTNQTINSVVMTRLVKSILKSGIITDILNFLKHIN